MRHKAATAHLGRSTKPRKALLRNLVNSLVEHGRIKTTVTKAKELRRHVERAVTLGKKGTLHARRVLLSKYPNQQTVDSIMKEISPRFQSRPGGYTRIIKLSARRGDCAELAFIEWVDYELPKIEAKSDKSKKSPAKPKATAKKKSTAKVNKAKKSE